MLPIDKQAHFWAGLAITLTISRITSPEIALVVGITAGLTKEAIHDYALKRGNPEIMDFVWTGVGALLGYAWILIF